MEAERFDAWSRALAGGSRRQVLRRLAAALLLPVSAAAATPPTMAAPLDCDALCGKLVRQAAVRRRCAAACEGSVCPRASRCQAVDVAGATGEASLAPCVAAGKGRALCAKARRDRGFRALEGYLLATGFAPAGAPKPAVEVFEVRRDGTPAGSVAVLRYRKKASGLEALLRYGSGLGGEKPTAYAIVSSSSGTVRTVLSVGADGKLVQSVPPVPPVPPASAAATEAGRRGERATPVDPDPYAGTADGLCATCAAFCTTTGAIGCGAIIAVLIVNPLAAAAAGALCATAGTEACSRSCKALTDEFLQQDPKNCGACGTACPAGQRCCAGRCTDTRNDPANCRGCGRVCPAGQPTCCESLCVDLDTDPLHCGRCGKTCGVGLACKDGACPGECPPGRACGLDRCCGPDELCVQDGCCPTDRVCPSGCCAAGETCISTGACCPTGWVCGSSATSQRCCDPASHTCIPDYRGLGEYAHCCDVSAGYKVYRDVCCPPLRPGYICPGSNGEIECLSPEAAEWNRCQPV